MRKYLLLIWMVIGSVSLMAQVPTYKWVNGDTTASAASVTKNTYMSPREKAASWTDKEGVLWVYGGEGYDSDVSFGYLNDLWKYDTKNNTWTWVLGESKINQSGVSYDNSMKFDGIDDQIEIEGVYQYNQDFTWEAMFKTSEEYGGIIQYGPAKNSGYCCGGDASIDLAVYGGQILVYNNANYFFSNTRVNDNQWHHVALTVEINGNGAEEIFTLYVDGQIDSSMELDMDELVDTSDTTYHVTKIGYSQYGWMKGQIDEVRIWQGTKTADELSASLGTKLTGNEDNLMAYYDFNQGTIDGDNDALVGGREVFPEVVFSKVDFADPTLEANQDRITNNVWLTRGDEQGLYNAAKEDSYDKDFRESPAGTLWAMGNTVDLDPSDYQLWYRTVADNGGPLSVIDQPMSLYLTNERRYFDITFTQWTSNANGGGFAYTRTEVGELKPSYDTLLDKSGNELHGTLLNFTNRAKADLKGQIAEVKVWTGVRTEAEILASYNGEILDETFLEAYYDFSDGVADGDNTALTTINDQSGNGYTGTLIDFNLNGTTSNFTSSDLPNLGITSTMQLDGYDDYIEIDGLRSYGSDFTWEAWVNTEEDGSILSFAPKGGDTNWAPGGFTLFINGGWLNMDVGWVGGWSATDGLSDGLWHHIAVTVSFNFEGENERVMVYVDGVLVSDTSYYDFELELNVSEELGFVTKIGSTSANFPSSANTTGGLTAGSPSNWTAGVFPKSLGGRSVATSITDNNHEFWLFGGVGVYEDGWTGYLNDLSKYDKENNEWIKIFESPSANRWGSYGVKGEISESSFPGTRQYANGWADADNNIWVFGGFGVAESDEEGQLNDLWKFDVTLEQWTWMGGANVLNELGVYGTKGTPSLDNIPGARDGFMTWVDQNGSFWLFGGSGVEGVHNDLWRYDPLTAEWTWVSGSSEVNKGGVYGTERVASETNVPGGRIGALTWFKDGKLWLFGGQGYDKNEIVLGIMNDLWSYDIATGLWTWEGGPDFADNTGDYAIFGVPSDEGVPGARRFGNSFVDDEGKFWLVAGYKNSQGKAGTYNDLWSYDTESSQWTWLGGIGGTADLDDNGFYGSIGTGQRQKPGARNGALTWVDEEGDLWMYGGSSGQSNTGLLNDLWQYDIQNQSWIYKGGSTVSEISEFNYGSKGLSNESNQPRSRWHAVSWYQEGDVLWFFGGISPDGTGDGITWLNDLWTYDIESGIYTWVGGSNTPASPGFYGTKDEPSVNKIPGARSSSASWVDAAGNMWLFGGYENFEYYNDLWKFNPNTKEWTWLTGRNSQNIPGNYGEKGVANPNNEIGSRRYMNTWVDNEGNFWVFGGQGKDKRSVTGNLNDMWKYTPSTKEWVWVHGSDTVEASGHYGTKGVAAPENTPPSRYGYSSWTDDSGNLWLFGGVNVYDEFWWYNDLWMFNPRTEMWTWMGGSEEVGQASIFGTLGVTDFNNVIGARERAMAFTGNDKSFWMFGGRRSVSEVYSDLWKIEFAPAIPYVSGITEIEQSSFVYNFDEAFGTSFLIEVSDSANFSVVSREIEAPNSGHLFVGDLIPGHQYYARVKASNEVGESEYSDVVGALTLPATPQFSEISVSDVQSSSAIIHWDQVEGVYDGYFLDVSRDSTFSSAATYLKGFNHKILEPELTSLTLPRLVSGKDYYVRLRSFNASGNSEYSEVLHFLTPPAAPLWLDQGIQSLGQNRVALQWNPVAEIMDGYALEVATDQVFANRLIGYDSAIISKSKLLQEVAGLQPGTNYYARIFAYNEAGLSVASDTISILTLPESPIFPTNSFVSRVTQYGAVLNWNDVSEVFDGYHLEVSTVIDFSNDAFFLEGYGKGGLPRIADKLTSHDTLKILEPGSIYYARVRAFNASGDSPNSNLIRIETVPLSPDFTDVSSISQYSASLSWDTPQGAVSFFLDLNTLEDFATEGAVSSKLPLAVPFQILEDLTPGTRYYARIQSSNTSGSSGAMTPGDYGDTTFITVPATPFIMEPASIAQTSVPLEWEALDGAEGYYIDVSDNGFQTVLTGYNKTLVTSNTIDVEGLDPGENFQIRLRSFNESGESPFSNVVSVLTVPATPIARDATTVSATGFTANWDQVTGAGYYKLEVTTDDFKSFIHEETYSFPNPVKITNIEEGKTVKYRVRAGNLSGESPNSNVVSVVAANNAQSLAFSGISFNDELNQNSTTASSMVSVEMTGGFGPIQVWIRTRPVLQAIWSDSIALEANASDLYQYEITASMMDEIGIEFEILATDGVAILKNTNNLIYWVFDDTNSESIPITQFGGGAGDWQIFSIPYQLDDNLVETIFNEMGPYKYVSDWRLMHYDGSKYLDAGSGINRIELGKGYWFNSVQEVNIQIGKGRVNTNSPTEMSLRAGWNQIGNPFNVPISWNAVRVNNDVSTTVEALIQYDTEQQLFVEGDVIQPFGGGFVWSENAVTLSISSVESQSAARLNDKQWSQHIDASAWMMGLDLSIEGRMVEVAKVGMHPEASWSKDEFDATVVPRFFNYTEMATVHSEYFYPWFSTDVVPTVKETSWLFELASNQLKGATQLSWDQAALSSAQAKMWLIDELQGQVIDMSQQSSYSFDYNGRNKFSLHYSQDPNQVPLSYYMSLGDPYPNPTEGRSTLNLSLPRGSDSYHVQLGLYDLLGNKVAEVVDREWGPGIHAVEQDLRNAFGLKAGVYFYQLTLDGDAGNTLVKKVILK